ncbi:MAG: hypothetical protein ACE5R6_02300 [Candidatus Heimdallarchaeota archaeon]
MDLALTLSEIQARVSDLIYKLANSSDACEDMIKAEFVNNFSTNLSRQAYMACQRERIEEELVESLINLLALAGMLGVDLERRLYETILLLETVSTSVG